MQDEKTEDYYWDYRSGSGGTTHLRHRNLQLEGDKKYLSRGSKRQR